MTPFSSLLVAVLDIKTNWENIKRIKLLNKKYMDTLVVIISRVGAKPSEILGAKREIISFCGMRMVNDEMDGDQPCIILNDILSEQDKKNLASRLNENTGLLFLEGDIAKAKDTYITAQIVCGNQDKR